MPVKITRKSRSVQAPPIIKPVSDRLQLPIRIKQKAISPGGGFWRQQLEFVVDNHSKVSKENAEYRQQIADLKMGQLIDHELSEFTVDERQEMKVRLRFAKCDHPDYPRS